MNPDAVRKFSQKAAAQRRDLFGVPVLFRDQELRLVVSTPDADLGLETGGFATRRRVRIRVPVAVAATRPDIGEPFKVIASGEIYRTTTVSELTGAAHAAEYIVEAEKA